METNKKERAKKEVQVIESESSAITSVRQTELPMNPFLPMIQQALASGAEITMIERFITLQREEEDRQSDRAFKFAMSRLQGMLPEISKTGKAKFQTVKGTTEYNFDSLSDINNALRPMLFQTGLSYKFEQKQDGNNITVKCTVRHELGFSESNQLTSQPDTSGSKNTIQALASTITYLQRYTLKAAFGIASVDDDGAATDGVKSEQEEKIKFSKWMATAKQVMSTQESPEELADWYGRAIAYSAQYNQKFVIELDEKHAEIKKAKGW
jgi:hypothetical protein